MTAPKWTIDGIDVLVVDTEIPEIRRGHEIEITGLFSESDGSLSDYNSLQEYAAVAGNYRLHESELSNDIRYRELDTHEDTPAGVEVVVDVTPPSESSNTPSLWVAIDDITDASTLDPEDSGGVPYVLEFELTVLATQDDYATRSGLEDALSEGAL